MLLWGLITVGALVAAVSLWGAYMIALRRHHSAWGPPRPRSAPCFYLDEDIARDLYLQDDKYPELQRSVQETTRRNTSGVVNVRPSFAGAEMTASKEREQVTNYIKHEGPITVIGRIIRALHSANDIVYVDLFNCTLAPGVGLDRALERTHGRQAKSVRSARLQDLDPFTFVSVAGRFRVTGGSETTTTLSAPYGKPTEFSDDLPSVSVTCDTEQLHLSVQGTDDFPARCLGKIKHWDPGSRRLVISPVLAIFR